MNKVLQTIIISFIFSCSVFAQTITGIVVSIADGDTFTLLDSDNKQIKIRLHGIGNGFYFRTDFQEKCYSDC